MKEILAVAMAAKHGEKFKKLWNGNWEADYPSQSEADLALAAMLAFYTGPDRQLLDDMFRQSGLYRDKWEREDYRSRVLAMALDRDEFYSWGASPEVETLAQEVAAKGGVEQLAQEVAASPHKKKGDTQTERLISLGEAAEFWRTPDYEAYASIPIGDHWENKRVRGPDFRARE